MSENSLILIYRTILGVKCIIIRTQLWD